MGIISKLRARYNDFRRKQRREGWKYALGKIKSNYQYIFLQDSNYQTERRIDLEERWDILSSEMDSEAKNLLDIGCNQGELTKRAASLGLFSVGIDELEMYIQEAKNNTGKIEAHFINAEITPDNIGQIPQFDIIFLLAVYRHWGKSYGWETAEDMLRTTVKRSNKQVFLEVPKSEEYIKSNQFQDIESENIVEKHQKYLNYVLENSINIQYIGTTDYYGGERKEIIFKIE